MSEMIERVARVINPWAFDPENASKTAPEAQHEARATARHLIAAMREPTAEQRNRYFEMKIAAGGWLGNAAFVDAEWERMVDAALAEPKA